MELGEQTLKVKHEPYEEIEIDSASVKVENEDLNESVCIKSERAKTSTQEATDSTFEFVGLEIANGVCQSTTDKIEIKTEPPEIAREDWSLLQSSHTCYSACPRIKVEQTKEDWDKTAANKEASKEIKLEDNAKVKCEDMESLEQNQQLDIDMKIDPSALSAELELESDAKEKNCRKQLVMDTEAGGNLYTCYNCAYDTNSKNDLLHHLNDNSCNMYEVQTTLHRKKKKRSFTIEIKREKWLQKQHASSSSGLETDRECSESELIKNPLGYGSVTFEKFACEYCDFKTIRHYTLKEHHKKQHSGAFFAKCQYCDYKANYIYILKKHVERVHDISTCSHCGEILKTHMSLVWHIFNKHEYFVSFVNNFYECSKCSYKSQAKKSVQDHMLTHFDEAIFTTTVSLNKPSDSSLNYIQCVHCKAALKNEHALDAHIVSAHPNCIPTLSYKLYKCSFCEFKIIGNPYNLFEHKWKQHGITPDFFLCKYCSAEFKRKKGLDEHLLTKHHIVSYSVSDELHKCPNCSFASTMERNLERHISKNECYARCEHCNLAFRGKLPLDDHILKKHPDFIKTITSNIYVCKLCWYKTTIQREFGRHLTTHSKDSI
ncbi:unnamed protein product [Acanthoscelides obtectus]|uniref:C2H2-type domain-containing protein n=1 Tax=Acanthoscelides obtectus TaxID=200917 RepID=A0A9P0L8L9_ACAOB|nr:unnamed protein product [Acanthoscelides obtectus]CAK1675962.1 Transcriptional repressor CTCF [Acanthoscelides obtectus]